MSEQLRITLRCFSHVRHALGADSMVIEVPPGSSTATVESRVREMAAPSLTAIPWRVALNQEFIAGEALLHDGDEVALIPPVQGG